MASEVAAFAGVVDAGVVLRAGGGFLLTARCRFGAMESGHREFTTGR